MRLRGATYPEGHIVDGRKPAPVVVDIPVFIGFCAISSINSMRQILGVILCFLGSSQSLGLWVVLPLMATKVALVAP